MLVYISRACAASVGTGHPGPATDLPGPARAQRGEILAENTLCERAATKSRGRPRVAPYIRATRRPRPLEQRGAAPTGGSTAFINTHHTRPKFAPESCLVCPSRPALRPRGIETRWGRQTISTGQDSTNELSRKPNTKECWRDGRGKARASERGGGAGRKPTQHLQPAMREVG